MHFDTSQHRRGRLAPSPTGYMHLGNAWSFMLAWLAARNMGGDIVLRIEDIDPERAKPEFIEGIYRDFSWLGIDWDEGPDCGGSVAPYKQSERLDRYAEIAQQLIIQGVAYPCFCSRKDLKSLASAPHLGEYCGVPYPGTCLHLSPEERRQREARGRRPSLRVHCDEDAIFFSDNVQGDVCLYWDECGGDFPIRRSDGVFSYQLAVVVDDIDQNINQIVRGDDILHCTPRQMLLYRLLRHDLPEYAHVPLVLNFTGERLAKRHAQYELRMLRKQGISAEAIVGYLAFRAGLQSSLQPAPLASFINDFSFASLPRQPVVLEEDIEKVLLQMS